MSYQPKLNLRETETAIKALKDFFEKALSLKLKLQRVSAPLFLLPETGLNDNLNGSERPVSFDIKETAALRKSCIRWQNGRDTPSRAMDLSQKRAYIPI